MSRQITAIFQDGVFRPEGPVSDLKEGQEVKVLLPDGSSPSVPHPIEGFIGCIPPDELDLMDRAIQEAFEKVDMDEWE